MFDIWSASHPLAEEAYEKDNYRIVLHPEVNNGECVIYFSSNNIWFPNTEEVFCRTILEKDRYEWGKKTYRTGEKNIYIRDIYKSWYVMGVSRELSSIDALVAWLQKETEGYEIVCIGSSAGGYMAALAGAKLSAKLTVCFSAQFDLYHPSCINVNPLLRRMREDAEKTKYYDISEIINMGTNPTVYVYPNEVPLDIDQAAHVKERKNIIKFGLKSRHHGIVFYKCNLPKLLNMDFLGWQELYCSGRRSPFFLSLKLSGWKETIRYIFHTAVKTAKRKH